MRLWYRAKGISLYSFYTVSASLTIKYWVFDHERMCNTNKMKWKQLVCHHTKQYVADKMKTISCVRITGIKKINHACQEQFTGYYPNYSTCRTHSFLIRSPIPTITETVFALSTAWTQQTQLGNNMKNAHALILDIRCPILHALHNWKYGKEKELHIYLGEI